MTLWYALCDALGAEFLSMNFMKNALLAVIVMAPLFGLLSTMIVTGKMSFFSDALGHSGFTGIAIGVLCGAALLTGNLCDRLVSLLRRRVYRAGDFSNESFALIIALLMPATVDWYVVIMAVLAGVLIGKEVFGGYGSYPFNPAAVGYAVAAVSWPEQVFRYPQPYTNIPLWDATGVPVSSTISDTLRSGGSLNISAISLGLGEYAAPMGTGVGNTF